MLSALNSKVVIYGVQIMNVKITDVDVTLPPDLQDRSRTNYRVQDKNVLAGEES